MKASWNWLRELVPGLPHTDEPAKSARAVADRLTLAGLEVEALIEFGAGLKDVLIVEVKSAEKHPTRDSLKLVTVDRGGGQLQRVVCGAPNVPDPGGLVVLAPLGTHLPAKNMTIEPRPIGGIVSEGMLCSETELGIGVSEGGILILPAGSAKPGDRFIDAFPSAHDWILEIGVTPNRPDALGHLGLARELAALYGLEVKLPSSAPLTSAGDLAPNVAGPVAVLIEDAARCHHYAAAHLYAEVPAESPMAARHRLFALGIRPISPLVDVTNLMLLEHAQPMHAFDRAKIRGGKIVVRRATAGEKLVLLDGKELALVEDDLVIADAEGPLALAGVMGGKDSGVSSSTHEIILEVAYFDPRSVRRSARRYGLHTESSHRFERGIDPEGVRPSIARAATVLGELAGGKAYTLSGEVHVHPTRWEAPTITLRSSRLDALIGDKIPFDQAKKILVSLGCEIREENGDSLLVAAPSWRPDLSREADLVEEVARVRGLDAIPTELPAFRPQPPRTTGALENRVRHAAIELGLSEALTYAFVSNEALDTVGAPAPAVTLLNPLTEERSVLRTSLLPGLLDALSLARRRGEWSARLFCTGRTFLPALEGSSLADERRGFAAVLAGPRPAYLAKTTDHDVYDARALAVELVERVTRMHVEVDQLAHEAVPAGYHPRAAAALIVKSGDHRTRVGSFGLLHPDALAKLDIPNAIAIVELDLDALEHLGRAVPKARPIPRLPAVTRDISLQVHDDVTSGQVEALIRQEAGDLCADVEVFDLFRGGAIPAEHRSLSFRIVYRDPREMSGAEGARTLTDAEVDERHQTVRNTVQQKLGAVQR